MFILFEAFFLMKNSFMVNASISQIWFVDVLIVIS